MKKCFWCDKEFKKLTRDHVVPKADGGNRFRYNIVMACVKCNTERGLLASLHGQIRSAKYNIETLTQEKINLLHCQRINLLKIREKWIVIEKEKRGHSASEELEFDPPGILNEVKPRSSPKEKKPPCIVQSVLKKARLEAEARFNQTENSNVAPQ